MNFRKLHALSATILGAFAGVHIANHLVAVNGITAHVAFMKTARSIYRLPAVEALLLACVLVQLISGLRLLVHRRNRRRETVSRIQELSGAYLLIFLVAHVGAVLVGRLSLGLDTNFHFAAAAFHVPPFPLFFALYYGVAVLSLFAHLGCAMYRRAPSAGRPVSPFVLGIPIAGGALLGAIIVGALAGAFYTITVPPENTAPFIRAIHGW